MAPLGQSNAASGVEECGEEEEEQVAEEEEFLTHYSLRKQRFLFFSKLTGNAGEFHSVLSTTSDSIALQKSIIRNFPFNSFCSD